MKCWRILGLLLALLLCLFASVSCEKDESVSPKKQEGESDEESLFLPSQSQNQPVFFLAVGQTPC